MTESSAHWVEVTLQFFVSFWGRGGAWKLQPCAFEASATEPYHQSLPLFKICFHFICMSILPGVYVHHEHAVISGQKKVLDSLVRWL